MNPDETAGQRRMKQARYERNARLFMLCVLAFGILVVTVNALDIGPAGVSLILAWFSFALAGGYATGLEYGRATDADENYHRGFRYGWRMGREFGKHASAQITQIKDSR